MKKAINNKMYDTNTAKALATADNGLEVRDFRHWEETLYLKRTGEYFLHGIGGPASKYAIPAGQNNWTSGEHIEPISLETARNWVQEFLDGDEYERIFGVLTEGEATLTVSNVPVALLSQIKIKAQEDRKSIKEVVVTAIQEYLNKA